MHKRKSSKKKGDAGGDDTKISGPIIEQANRAVLRQVKVNRTFDVPYLAGYSEDGKTIYIDRDLPKTFSSDGKRFPAHPFVVLHESVEKALVDQLGLVYQHAHQIALRVEQAAVRDAGVPWRQYDAFMQKYIKMAEERPDLHIPPDLDLKPYRDEDDAATLHRMRRDSRKHHRRRRKK
jgi:hypothetical protein